MPRTEATNKITSSIKAFLEHRPSFDDPASVLYLMAEVRKVLESEKDYSRIRLYANWTLHIRLDESSSYIKKFFKDVDFTLDGDGVANELKQKCKDFLELQDLKTELEEFAKKYDLKFKFLDNNTWFTFLETYLEIVMECPNIEFGNPKTVSKISLEKKGPRKYKYRFSLVGSNEKPKVKLTIKWPRKD